MIDLKYLFLYQKVIILKLVYTQIKIGIFNQFMDFFHV